MTPIIITALILIILALTIKVIKQAIWINDQKVSDDWEDTDEACCYHISKEYCDGDCCRCEECTDRYHKELIYEPCVFNDLNIKTHNIGEDFGYTAIIGEIDVMNSEGFSFKCEDMEKGKSVPMDFECGRRDGLHEHEQLYAIYEDEDVDKLIYENAPRNCIFYEDEDVDKLIYRLQTRKK